jgi:hypothetical protein
MWHKPGLIKTGESAGDPTEIPVMQLVSGHALTELAKDYEFFNPFVLPLALPELPFDLITECRAELGVPREPKMMILDQEVFDYGKRGKHFGVPGNLLMLVPKDEWPTLDAFIRSIAVTSAQPGLTCALHVQHVRLLDPQVRHTGPFDPAKNQVTVHVAVAENNRVAAVLAPDAGDRYGCMYSLRFVSTAGSVRMAEICALFMRGDNDPITTVDLKSGTAAAIGLDQPSDVESDRDADSAE